MIKDECLTWNTDLTLIHVDCLSKHWQLSTPVLRRAIILR
jgi:hypothetical protein